MAPRKAGKQARQRQQMDSAHMVMSVERRSKRTRQENRKHIFSVLSPQRAWPFDRPVAGATTHGGVSCRGGPGDQWDEEGSGIKDPAQPQVQMAVPLRAEQMLVHET
ncbi:unnamed protein product [Symbiodinium natans]|uniref:Uncharacterized protein n=1 Tax=Symbiodinium natans TaxID=878477 RepID=A0A812QVD2_9DINO|nr:unnamed protein product [Symbiodinium natans]